MNKKFLNDRYPAITGSQRMATMRIIVFLLLVLTGRVNVSAQQTPGGTVISNQASASYSDGTNSYAATSNTVTITVSNVGGLTITPDAGTTSNITNGELKTLSFTLTNTGNFAQGVIFPASGAGITVSANLTVTRAVIDVNSDGSFDGGDTDIFTNGAAVTSANVALNSGTLTVLVEVRGSSTTGAATVTLGDTTSGSPTFDNQAADSTAGTVKTSDATAANGAREAAGSYSFSVIADASLRLSLTAPSGPVSIGDTISYNWQVCNVSSSATAQAATLNGTGGPFTGVFIIAPLPAGTTLASGQSFTGATQVLYTTDPLTTSPLSASWTTTQPTLSTITRIAFKVSNTLAASACSATIQMDVTVNSGINTSTPIVEIGDAFAMNNASTPAVITDQSGDSTPGLSDGNANYTQPVSPNTSTTSGVSLPTTLTTVGAVLNGPNGAAGATGPDGTTATDFTNLGANNGLSGVASGGVTTAANTVTFTNTVQNTGTGNDTYTLTVPNAATLFSLLPAGAQAVITTSAGSVTLNSSNTTGSVTVSVSYGSTANYTVAVTLPSGTTVLPTTSSGGFDVQVLATSNATSSASNLTTDTVYTGFVKLTKSATVSNSDLTKGGATDPVPGAVITYTITYSNISKTLGSGSGSVTLNATSIVIDEDGSAAPNNWGTLTTQVVSPAPSDSLSGAITDGTSSGAVTVSTTYLKDTVPGALAPGQSGTFTFKRTIK